MIDGQAAGRILLVEDDADIRLTVSEILDDAGYAVQAAAGGEEALKLVVRGRPPDLILLDLMMPGMNGWSFYKELREDPLRADIPIVIFSAVGSIDSYAQVIGAVGVLRKPVQVDDLLDMVARHCNGRRGRGVA